MSIMGEGERTLGKGKVERGGDSGNAYRCNPHEAQSNRFGSQSRRSS